MSDIKINNPKKKEHADVRNCPNCGASVLSEICQYCGTYIGEVATENLTAEYEMVECKSGRFSFWRIVFPAIFAFGFLIMPLCCFVPMLVLNLGNIGINSGNKTMTSLFLIPFFLVGIGALIVTIKGLYQWFAVNKFGVVHKGTVYGYMDDTVAYNGVNGKKIKILVNTNEGSKFIMLPLETTVMKYEVNSTVNVKLYKNYAKIVKKESEW